MTSRSAAARSSEVPISIGLDAVIVAVTDEVPRVLTVDPATAGLDEVAGGADLRALPNGPLDAADHATLEKGLRTWVAEQTGLDLGYVEQLYTFGDRYRDPRERDGGPRVVSAAYLALAREQSAAIEGAGWSDWYAFLPWEDWRDAPPALLATTIEPALLAWAGRDRQRVERAELSFGLGAAPWDPERSLDRYELLYEARLIPEAGPVEKDGFGRPMALDHRRILATALGRLRGKVKYRPVVFELLPEAFTLLQLQQVVEALAGGRLHKQNFRRLVSNAGLVEATGRFDSSTGGRPAELFHFRREVLRERPAPGVSFSGARWEAR